MARPLRIEYPGAWYHVMNRGLGRRFIFQSDEHRQCFLDLLGEASQIFQLEVHAFSLMDNHYHLLVHTPLGGLGRAMRHLNGLYTQNFNRLLGTDGPLFRGRYKALLVESEEYLTELVRYIHLNPVKAGICTHPEDHPWTSHAAYLQSRKKPSWLMTDEVLGRFGPSERVATTEMDKFVLEGVPEEFEEDLKKQRIILGSKGFQEWVYENILGEKKKSKEIAIRDRRPRSRVSPKRVLDLVAHAYNVEVAALRQGIQGQENEPRGMAVYFLRRLAGLSHKDTASWLNCPTEYTVATIQRRFREKLGRERRLRKLTRELSHSMLTNVKT